MPLEFGLVPVSKYNKHMRCSCKHCLLYSSIRKHLIQVVLAKQEHRQLPHFRKRPPSDTWCSQMPLQTDIGAQLAVSLCLRHLYWACLSNNLSTYICLQEPACCCDLRPRLLSGNWNFSPLSISSLSLTSYKSQSLAHTAGNIDKTYWVAELIPTENSWVSVGSRLSIVCFLTPLLTLHVNNASRLLSLLRSSSETLHPTPFSRCVALCGLAISRSPLSTLPSSPI